MGFISKLFGKNNENKPLWEGFYGGNDEESLLRKADIFHYHLFNSANGLHKYFIESLGRIADGSENVKELTEKVNAISNETFNQFLFEILYLFIHVSDKTAFNILNLDQRNIFIDRLQERVVQEICKNGTDKECKSFPIELNDRQTHYSQYKKLMTKTEEGTKDSLVANFSYQISELLVGKDDLLVSLPLQIAVSQYIIDLRLPELLEDRS